MLSCSIFEEENSFQCWKWLAGVALEVNPGIHHRTQAMKRTGESRLHQVQNKDTRKSTVVLQIHEGKKERKASPGISFLFLEGKSFLLGHWYPCFWTSGDVYPGFEARIETLICLLHYLHAMNSPHSYLMWHLLTSWWPVWQPSHFDPHTCIQALVGLDSGDKLADVLQHVIKQSSTDWAKPVRPQIFLLSQTFLQKLIAVFNSVLVWINV